MKLWGVIIHHNFQDALAIPSLNTGYLKEDDMIYDVMNMYVSISYKRCCYKWPLVFIIAKRRMYRKDHANYADANSIGYGLLHVQNDN